MQERLNGVYDVIVTGHDTKKNLEDNKQNIMPFEMVISTDTNDLLFKDEQGNLRGFFGATGDINDQIKQQVDNNTVNIQTNAEAIGLNVKHINDLKLDKLDKGAYVGTAEDLNNVKLNKGSYAGTADDLKSDIDLKASNIMREVITDYLGAENWGISELRNVQSTYLDNDPSKLNYNGIVNFSSGLSKGFSIASHYGITSEFYIRGYTDNPSGNNGSNYKPFYKMWTDASCTISKSENGWCKLANGLIVQWGQITTTDGEAVINFPIAFSSDYKVMASSNVGLSHVYPTSTFRLNQSSARIYAFAYIGKDTMVWARAQSDPIQWIAIGY
ncbi:MAG: gp53-like domain-containing protein [Cetobacterium sp.]|uniref:gp53-like domain-containing protein n=1 Tax=Cetobacterium sp. TaxID=2071632 RepID=UPI003EE5885E